MYLKPYAIKKINSLLHYLMLNNDMLYFTTKSTKA